VCRVESSSHHNGDNVAGDKIINNNQRTIHAENYYENYNVKNIYYTKEGNKSTPIPKVYNASIVSIHNVDNEIVGSGCLVTSNYIVTTHENIANLDNLKVTFALRDPQTSFEAKLIDSNSTHNIALLKIESEEPFNIPLATTTDYGKEFVVCGFDTQTNSWLEESYKGGLSDGKKQITLKQEPMIAKSFSSAPVWNIAKGGISGVMMDSGLMIPIQKVIETCKPLQEALRNENSDILSKEMFKDWVWKSSVESADRLQFSVLALIETVIAVSISFFVWFSYDFYWHIVTGLVAAPLFFLRTKKSETYALDKFLNYKGSPYEIPSFIILGIIVLIYFIIQNINFNFFGNGIVSLFFGFIYGILIGLALYIFLLALGSKIFSTVKHISYQSFISIPKNWFKIIHCIDMFHYPELIPGIEKRQVDKDSFLKWSGFVDLHYKSKMLLLERIIIILLIFPVHFLYIAVLLFRYSLKSTAWIYLPFIWLIIPSSTNNLTTNMKIESQNFIAYLMFLYSLIVVFVFTFTSLLFPQILQEFSIPTTLQTIFLAYPENLNVWHITRFLSAVITIVFMVSFSKILIYRDNDDEHYGKTLGAKIYSLRRLRSYLTLITLFFTAYHILAMIPDGFFVELFSNMKVVPN